MSSLPTQTLSHPSLSRFRRSHLDRRPYRPCAAPPPARIAVGADSAAPPPRPRSADMSPMRKLVPRTLAVPMASPIPDPPAPTRPQQGMSNSSTRVGESADYPACEVDGGTYPVQDRHGRSHTADKRECTPGLHRPRLGVGGAELFPPRGGRGMRGLPGCVGTGLAVRAGGIDAGAAMARRIARLPACGLAAPVW